MVLGIGILLILPMLWVVPKSGNEYQLDGKRTVLWPQRADRQLPAELRRWFNLEARRLASNPTNRHPWVFLATREGATTPDTTDELVVLRFEGSCDYPSHVPIDSRIPLGSVTMSNGVVAPYITLHCARILQAIEPHLVGLTMHRRSQLIARALLRVTLHELEHIHAQSAAHKARGLHKASLSARDLIADWAIAEDF